MHYEQKVEIDAPQSVVWEVLADVSRWPEWTESVAKVSRTDNSALAAGSRVRIKQPRMPSLVWEVFDLEPGTSFSWRSASPGVAAVATHLVEPAEGARVAVTLGITFSGPLAPLTGLLTGARTRRYLQMEADGLKSRSESRHRAV